MNRLAEKLISCPYCGEVMTLLLDGSVAEQEYIEDCQVCCRPMRVQVSVSVTEEVQVIVFHEDD
jgi:hypothetical protein